MKKYLFLIIGVLMVTAQRTFCVVEAVSPELEKSLKTHANEPGGMSIIFALLFVIFLIYITGVIYSKLNIVGAKTVQNQLKNCDLNKAVVLSTTQLGQGKNLHVIEWNNKRFLIGVAQDSINLLKELGDVEEVSEDGETEVIEKEEEQFDVHKKYL